MIMYYNICESSLRTLKYIWDIIIVLIAFILFPQSIYSPVDLKYSTEQRKLVSSILHELKTRKPRYLIQKG